MAEPELHSYEHVHSAPSIFRLRVEGGWVYRTTTGKEDAVALCFVPDAPRGKEDSWAGEPAPMAY